MIDRLFQRQDKNNWHMIHGRNRHFAHLLLQFFTMTEKATMQSTQITKQIFRTNSRKTFWSQRIFYLWNKILDNFFDAKSPKEWKNISSFINKFRQNITDYLGPKLRSIQYQCYQYQYSLVLDGSMQFLHTVILKLFTDYPTDYILTEFIFLMWYF